MQSLPVASVLVCCRNGGPLLTRALKSARTAMRPHDELIVVLDADTATADDDHQRAVAGDATVVWQRRRGLAAARNEAIAASSGELIAFLDADDRWTPRGLECRRQVLASNQDVVAVRGRLTRELLPGVAPTPGQRALVGVSAPGLTPGAIVFRRSVLATLGGFDETFVVATDSDWVLRLLRLDGRAVVELDEVVLLKGANPTSLSATLGERYQRELLDIARRQVIVAGTAGQRIITS
jgi:glycosyltransferase involved in cell wall biosynthesis